MTGLEKSRLDTMYLMECEICDIELVSGDFSDFEGMHVFTETAVQCQSVRNLE